MIIMVILTGCHIMWTSTELGMSKDGSQRIISEKVALIILLEIILEVEVEVG
jgi:hypothetical protein